MNLNEDDLQMAVRDFFSPALLLEFIDLPDLRARIRWGEKQFDEGQRDRSVRRLEGEPDAGCLTRWAAMPSGCGFRYDVEARGGARSGFVYWQDVHRTVNSRLTPVRYGFLRAAVEAVAAHEAAYIPGPVPFRTPELWTSLFYRPWARRASGLELKASAALDAICPPAKAQPALF
ncbi:hypothetical protein GCM10022403_080290 [Streptomyces coacervatus]|uniref:Uncharacterized protein n=2 Tax=Streptomyces coacervatus TaxID=647381 RepID=A0ABP7J6V7_9ACTN|nr:hypothetical protein [Streptomyces coacervatus]